MQIFVPVSASFYESLSVLDYHPNPYKENPMQIDQEEYEFLQESLLRNGVEGEWSYTYSGRSMYGQRCLSFVPDQTGIGELMYNLGYLAASGWVPLELLETMSSNYRTDNMGMGTVIYFPSVQVEEES